MKNKKILIFLIAIAFLVIIGLSIYFYFFQQDKDTTLTIQEKQWIESNKNKVVDISILNDIPLFNNVGEGIVFDFISDLESATGLEFNKNPYTVNEEPTSKYAFKIVNTAQDNDILVYKDNYALFTVDKQRYNSLLQMNNMTIGVLNSDLTEASGYLSDCKSCIFKPYTSIDKMFADILGDSDAINSVVVLKNAYMNKLLSNNDLTIAYNIVNMTRDYVITLGDIDRLNTIISKYFNKWYNDNYSKKYAIHFVDNYFTYNKVDEKDQVNAKSKRYKYGFVNYAPYDVTHNGKYMGINSAILKRFADLSNMEIDYKEYKDSKDLLEAFNANKVDFFFNNLKTNNYAMDVYETVSNYDEDIVIMAPWNSNEIIDSASALKGKNVSVIENSKIANYLKDKGAILKNYDNLEKLLNSNASIMAIDLLSYNYYVKNNLNTYHFLYQFKMDDDYDFVARDIGDNKVFNRFFDFYLQYLNEGVYVNSSLSELNTINSKPSIIKNIFVFGSYIIAAILALFGLRQVIRKRKQDIKVNYRKIDKLRYIDTMTSLKNRNYFNDNVEKWDASEVYPQAVIIIDLNNIAYINDNYGHSEGDKVIKEAANTLIRNQISNTEMIRTNGNEFLVYMVGYDEKQVLNHIKKMLREFKNLSHGFGAAAGYSMIMDAIKTIDDAVNEATQDMRYNKEEAHNEKQS